jgi:hypothetical protein
MKSEQLGVTIDFFICRGFGVGHKDGVSSIPKVIG